jgi:sensor histidine kinase YesM
LKPEKGVKTMFNHRFKFIFPGLLGLYSFWNIVTLEGDRLFQAELPTQDLFYVVIILAYAVWFANWGTEKFILPRVKIIHPLILQFLSSVAIVTIIALVSVEITGLILGGAFAFSFQNFLLTIGFTFRINLFLNCVNAIFFFNRKLNEKALETEKLKTLTTQATLQSINTQLNPHFFFNNLSALSVLIHENVDQADAYLQRLSVIYRYILNHQNQELVTVSEEMDFLKNYIALLSIRFKDSLTFKMELDPSCPDRLIPPAVLQLLVENAVKHNYFTLKEPLEIRITNNCEKIEVFNRKQSKKVLEESTGIGLQNISERYRFLNLSVNIEDETDSFRVTLPLIETDEHTFSRRRTFSPATNK